MCSPIYACERWSISAMAAKYTRTETTGNYSFRVLEEESLFAAFATIWSVPEAKVISRSLKAIAQIGL